MRQDEINRDLGSYLHERKDKPLFGRKSSTMNIKPRHEFDDEVIVRHEIERESVHADEKAPAAVHQQSHETMQHHDGSAFHHVDNVAHETRPSHYLHDTSVNEHIQHKESTTQPIEESDETKIKVEDVDKPEEGGALKKFFKKLSFSKDDEDEGSHQIGHMDMSDNPEITMDDEELRELLHGLHNWIIQLPSDKLERFKTSREFELYTKYLRKHNLIK